VRPILLALIAFFSAASGAVGEERLPEIVVTAPAIKDETPAPADPTSFASVIETREAATTVETLSEALADTVGVQVRRFGGLGDFSTVSIRGFSPGQVQVYLDGVPLSRADNETVNLSDLPLDAVDHVEVYRGTTPLAFAQSGPGGVVNVVTRRPEGAPLAAASASYGSFDTRKTTLAAGTSRGAWDGLVFAQYLGSQGDFDFTNTIPAAGSHQTFEDTRINNAFDQGNLTARLVYRDAPYTVAVTADSFAKSQGMPGRGEVQSATGHQDTFRQVADVTLGVAPSGPLSIGAEAKVYGLHQEQSFRSDDVSYGARDTDDTSTTVGGQLVLRGAVGTHHVPGLFLASGVERFVSSDAIGGPTLRPGTSPPRTRARLTLAGEDEIVFLSDRVSVVPSVRWELYHDEFPGDPRSRIPTPAGSKTQDFVSPRLGLRADVGWGTTLLANGGRSARIPNLTELFGTSGTIVGNEDLKPETATSWDAGFRFRSPWTNDVVTAASLEYAYFSSDVEDVIVFLPSSQNLFRAANIDAATIRGHEVSLRLAFVDRLLLTTNYTHQDALDASEDPNFRGKQLPGRPADEAYARLELVWSHERPLPLGALGAHLWPGKIWYDVDLIADNFLDPFNRLRVGSRELHGVGIDLTLPWWDLRVAAEAKNVTGDQTQDALGFPLPGRALFFTVSYGFGEKR
jgi:iron complex outermembrane receptor protein